MPVRSKNNLPYQRFYFEEKALNYKLGDEIYQTIKNAGQEVNFLKTHNRVTGIPGKNDQEAFIQGKNTLVVGVRKTLDFASCKPSAHFQLPLVTGCPGLCQYCYLNTNLGKKPYTRLYVNVDEILNQALHYIMNRRPEPTVFEASATADPVPVEGVSGSLTSAVEFFADQENGLLRLATKFPCPERLLNARHQGRTRIRYSLNTEQVISQYERRTPNLTERLDALQKVMDKGYPAGILLAPILLDIDWQKDYLELLEMLRSVLKLNAGSDLHFEVISHRFTLRARQLINQVFPHNALPMDEKTGRSFKFGQFGYGKYLYEPGLIEEMKEFFKNHLARLFPQARLEYII